MRIIAGSAKGCRLRSLRGRALRPTTDRMRETVFAILGLSVEGAHFLDLYAGVGGVGLEALSRGAERATFIESHRPAARLIEENAAHCKLSDRVQIITTPVLPALKRLRQEEAQFDIIFLDPPYGAGEAATTLKVLSHGPGVLAENGLIICQLSRREELPDEIAPLDRMRTVKFGETVIEFFKWEETLDHGALCRNV